MIYHDSMNMASHLTGASGAALGMAIPLLAALIAIPPLACRGVKCEQGISGSTAFGTEGTRAAAALPINLTWSPYIDNPLTGAGTMATVGPNCRSSGTPPPMMRLDWAPLPRAYDPAGYSSQQLFACVLTSGEGRILDARLVEGTGNRALDREMVRMIDNEWRFEPLRAGRSSRGWQRIRVNEGPKLEQLSVY